LGGVNDFLYGDFNKEEIFSSGDVNTEIDGVTLLRKAAEDKHVSDLHVRVGRPPVVRRMGRLVPLKGFPVLSKEDTENIIYGLLKEKQKKYLEENLSLDFSVEVQGAGRFRGNAFYYEGCKLGCVFRKIAEKIPPLSSLGLPPVVEALKKEHKGLILVTGPTGSGKSTTCAALCNEILNERGIHLLTIEDPIEYVYKDKKCYFYQRELGIDTPTFHQAVKDALREDPDVILVGEMRDRETVEAVLHAAETGHTVFSTLHTLDAKETINRIISLFPAEQERQIRYLLASTLRATVSQRLIRRADGNGRIPAVEILINTEAIRERIIHPQKTNEIYEFMEKGSVYGMVTMDNYLKYLVKKNLISPEDALENATKKEEFALFLKGIK